MGTLQQHLKGTIEYTQKLLSIGERVVFDVAAEFAGYSRHKHLTRARSLSNGTMKT
jgi:hypothetical protein